MRTLFLALLALSVTGCTSWSMNYHLNNAYRAYKSGDCQRVQLELSETERKARARPWIQPEISMLRGQCLEREKMSGTQVDHMNVIADTRAVRRGVVPSVHIDMGTTP